MSSKEVEVKTVTKAKAMAFLNYRRGLCSWADYELALLQIELREVGVTCPWCLIEDMRHYWRAFCEAPERYPGLVDTVNNWIDEQRGI